MVTGAIVVGTLGLMAGVWAMRGPRAVADLPTLRLVITTPPSSTVLTALPESWSVRRPGFPRRERDSDRLTGRLAR